MVVYTPTAPSAVRLASADDMYNEDDAPKAKRKGSKFSHYRRSRVSKAPRKRTFIMHMTKYPDAWISSLSNAASSDVSSGSTIQLQANTVPKEGLAQGVELFLLRASCSNSIDSDADSSARSTAPVEKRRVSPFAAASLAAFQICSEEATMPTVKQSLRESVEQGPNELSPVSDSASTVEGLFPSVYHSSVSQQQLSLLGAGGQGVVYKGYLAGEAVAFKFPAFEQQGEQDGVNVNSMKAFEREVAVLSMYQHQHIISCLAVHKDGPCPYVVEEYAQRGSLHDWLYATELAKKAEGLAIIATRALRSHHGPVEGLLESLPYLALPAATGGTTGAFLKWQEWSAGSLLSYIAILQVLLDITSALSYLHTATPKVIHRDLKPDNVLLTADGMAKLADFGVAKILYEETVASTKELFGTANYAAPEDLWGSSERVGPAADIYSLGCIAWECFAGERPWMRCSEYSIMFSVGQGMRHLMLPDSCPTGLQALLAKCLAFDPSVRPSAPQVHAALAAEMDWATNLLVATLHND